MISSLFNRLDYPSLHQSVYLNQASLGLIGQPAVTAMHTLIDNVARHGNVYMSDEDEVAYCGTLRERASRLLHCNSDQVAIVSSASEILGQLPMLLQPRSKSTVLTVSSDFPAITRPWLRLAALKNHTVRFVDDQPTCDLTDTLIGAIDDSTSVVAVSSVQYATGTVVDISRLRQSTIRVGARLIVDATRAAGAMPVDAAAWDADAVVTSGYKWLGGHGGIALAIMSPRLLQQLPPLPGWMGAANPFGFDATALSLANDARRYTQSTCHISLWRVSWSQLSSCCHWVNLALRHMHRVWKQCWLVKPASMVGDRFVVLTILLALHTLFRLAILAKAYKKLWKGFVVTILCAVHVRTHSDFARPLQR
jgi:cysteine desulfurase/selenocysteine lyase